jgi:hypothetical protein
MISDTYLQTAIGGFKYLTVEELEKFISRLKWSIDKLEKDTNAGTIAKHRLEEEKAMLNAAEHEIVERALLCRDNSDGSST